MASREYTTGMDTKFMRGFRFNDGRDTVILRLWDDLQVSDGTVNVKLLAKCDILTAKTIPHLYKEAATLIDRQRLLYASDRQGVLVRHSNVSGSIQKVVRASSIV